MALNEKVLLSNFNVNINICTHVHKQIYTVHTRGVQVSVGVCGNFDAQGTYTLANKNQQDRFTMSLMRNNFLLLIMCLTKMPFP